MKLLKTIRLDPSDTFVFEAAAEPGEWAVSGAFAFWDVDAASLQGKSRTAFRSGFLGVVSGGRSTLVQVVEAAPADRDAATDQLAQQLVERFGAPNLVEARAAAAEEVSFAASLCNQPLDTLIAVHRTLEKGEIRESFRTLRPRGDPKQLPVFSLVAMEGDGDDEPGETIDLAALAREQQP